MKKSNLQKIALFIMITISIIFIIIAYINQGNNFWLTVAGGIATGALVAVAQYFVSIAEHKEIDAAYKELHEREKEIQAFEDMGVQKILSSRDNPETYGTIISNTNERFWVMGNTSARLLEDFANVNTNSEVWYRRELIKFLDRGGEVRILVAQRSDLKKQKEKAKFDAAKDELKRLSDEYDKFNFVYFKHIPTHSIVVFDNQCLVGPVFENLESKSTPTLHMAADGEYAQKYLSYFNDQWAMYSR